MGVELANLLQTYINHSEIHSGSSLKPSFLYSSISAGNRRERSKIKKLHMIIQEYFCILENINSFHNLRPFPPVTCAYRMNQYIEKRRLQ